MASCIEFEHEGDLSGETITNRYYCGQSLFFFCLLACLGDDESAVTAGSSKSVRSTSMVCSIDCFFPDTEKGTRVRDSVRQLFDINKL